HRLRLLPAVRLRFPPLLLAREAGGALCQALRVLPGEDGGPDPVAEPVRRLGLQAAAAGCGPPVLARRAPASRIGAALPDVHARLCGPAGAARAMNMLFEMVLVPLH